MSVTPQADPQADPQAGPHVDPGRSEQTPSAGSRPLLALAGVLAGAAGVATSQGVTVAAGAEQGPVGAVAAAVRDLTPGPVANSLVHLVGHADKPLLIGGTTVILLALCAGAGLLTRRHRRAADLVFVVLGMLGLLAIAGSPHPGVAAVAALVAGTLTWIVALRFLTAPILAQGHAQGRVQPGDGPSRRGFLMRGGAVLGVAAFVALGGELVGGGRRKVEQARRLLRLPVHAGSQPAGVDLGVEGIAPWRTPSGGFYQIATAFSPPSISPTDWELRIHGMVDKEIRINYRELLKRELTEAWITLCCVSNEVGGDLIGNAYWSGVPIRTLLAEAGVQAGADAVKQTSQDGWTCGTPLEALTDDRNALLAVAMNGKPLPVVHGFPVRMVVPGLYGYVSATKWLVDLEVTKFSDFSAFWTDRGWAEKGPVRTESRIDVPRTGQTTKTGRVRIGGSAWAQHTGIAKVEFQLDGGPWQSAELGRVPDSDTWVQWAGSVDLDSGRHQLTVRATDSSGYTQTSARADPIPSGATGWDSVFFETAS